MSIPSEAKVGCSAGSLGARGLERGGVGRNEEKSGPLEIVVSRFVVLTFLNVVVVCIHYTG